jgi:hypothetical protein
MFINDLKNLELMNQNGAGLAYGYGGSGVALTPAKEALAGSKSRAGAERR